MLLSICWPGCYFDFILSLLLGFRLVRGIFFLRLVRARGATVVHFVNSMREGRAAWLTVRVGLEIPNRRQTYCFPSADNKQRGPRSGWQIPEGIAGPFPPGARRVSSPPASRECLC